MREIKFKAKRKDNGEWVEGFLFELFFEGIWCIGKEALEPNDYSEIIGQNRDWFEIIPDTICQYTGLKDKNGKEIYEGDILHGEFYGYPFPCIETFTVKWHKADAGFLANYFNNAKCEVIGNIFDNPELLEVDKQASKYADNDVMKPAT